MPRNNQLGNYRSYGHRPSRRSYFARLVAKHGLTIAKKIYNEYNKRKPMKPKGPPPEKYRFTKGRRARRNITRFQGYGTMPKTKFAKPHGKLSTLTKPFGTVSHGKSGKDLKHLNRKYDQESRFTIYYSESDALNSDGIITKREPILTNSSVDENHAFNIVQELTYCPDAEITIGNQRMPVMSNNKSPIYSTNGTGTALVPGLVHSESTKFPIITCTALPRSAELESKPFQIPTHIWSSAQIKLSFMNTCATAQTISLKVVRFKDTIGFNKSLNDGSMIGVAQGLCNHVSITDKQEYDTLWSYKRTLPGLNPNRKQSRISVNKTIFANYMRSTLHRNSSHTGDDKLGGQLLPQFKQTNESYNTVYLVLSILQSDDKVVKFETTAIPQVGSTTTTEGWISDVDPVIGNVTAGSNKVYVFGHVSNRFKFREVYSRTEAVQMSALQSQLHSHPEDAINLAGTWTNNVTSTTWVITGATSGNYDYVATHNTGVVFNVKQHDETAIFHSSAGGNNDDETYIINPNGTMNSMNGALWTKS